MSKVQIDDLECSDCGQLVLGELDTKTGVYTKVGACECDRKVDSNEN